MVSRVLLVLLLYAVVELAVVVALAVKIGVGWTLLLLLATFAAGLAVAGAQIGRHLRGLLTEWRRPDRLITDSVLIAIGTVLVAVPGLASTLAGLLCLLSPTRALARPMLTAVTLGRLGGLGWAVPVHPVYPPGRGDYIDGEVIEVTDVTDVTDVADLADATEIEPPALLARPTP